MVVIRLLGGLGNQMFQYALGQSLAVRRGDRLMLDTRALSSGEVPRRFDLNFFKIQGSIYDPTQILASDVPVVWSVAERVFGFTPQLFDECVHHKDIYVRGWWQSENYFNAIRDTVHEHFAFRPEYICPHSPALIEEIRESNSVCVHVRRTDYLTNGDARGFVGLEYYGRAIQMLMEKTSKPKMFVFSDDISWCLTNLDCPLPATFVAAVKGHSSHPVDDLYLMALCKHFIIANSTYSWWSAWLSQNQSKVIIAPVRWFRGEGNSSDLIERSLSSKNVIPLSWIRV